MIPRMVPAGTRVFWANCFQEAIGLNYKMTVILQIPPFSRQPAIIRIDCSPDLSLYVPW